MNYEISQRCPRRSRHIRIRSNEMLSFMSESLQLEGDSTTVKTKIFVGNWWGFTILYKIDSRTKRGEIIWPDKSKSHLHPQYVATNDLFSTLVYLWPMTYNTIGTDMQIEIHTQKVHNHSHTHPGWPLRQYYFLSMSPGFTYTAIHLFPVQ